MTTSSPRRARSLALALAVALPASAAAAPVFSAAAAPAPAPAPAATQATLLTRSILPAETYTPASETSGHFVTGSATIPAPFTGQPVQGFSATHRLGDGSYLVMSDNGFGTKENSADFLLAVHRIRPTAGKDGKPGTTKYLNTVFTLSDPYNLVPWQIWRDGACAAAANKPANYTCPTADRTLTGWDFDIESMQVAKDGTFWFGEEFGPYLLHTDQLGRLLSPPIPTPGIKAPQNPTLGAARGASPAERDTAAHAGEQPNIASSKGFEGMAISPDGKSLYPLLEGATAEDKAAGRASDLRFGEVSIAGKRAHYTGRQWRYRMEDPANAIGDFIAVNDHQFLVIERDNGQGATAAFKRIYLVDIRGIKTGGYATKTLVADLMNVSDPNGVGGMGSTFTFPFVTIEDVELIDANTIAVMNDNNFPAAGGRGPGVTDASEYIELRLPKALDVDPRLLGSFVPYGTGAPAGKGKNKAAMTLSVIGDVPYGDKQIGLFPGWVDDINAARTDATVHLGDIKNGSTRCDDPYFSFVKGQFDRFAQPLVYTPGDNEWTDCHRPNNGGYDPLERLAAIRKTFFAKPGVTNGEPMAIRSEAAQGFPENVMWTQAGVSFAAVHIVGSDNSMDPWTGKTAPTPEQVAEVKARTGNAISVIDRTFAEARRHKGRAVVIGMQADMFDPGYEPKPGENRAFVPVIQKLVDEAADFDGPVYLLDGDSHIFNVDQPLATGSRWLGYYGITGAADNLTRVTVDGSDNNTNWLRMQINRKGDPISFVQVPYSRF